MGLEKKYELILASKSPRRKALLNYLNIPFKILNPDIVEESDFTSPIEVASDIATKKGKSIIKQFEKEKKYGISFFPFVLSADTIVVLGSKIYGKPKNKEDARRILSELSGKTHEVITSVYLGWPDLDNGNYKEKCFYCSSEVGFSPINDRIMDDYLKVDDCMDKAGAYGIQGPSLIFVSRIHGSYSNVVGLPVTDLIAKLDEFLGHGGDIDWRKKFNNRK